MTKRYITPAEAAEYLALKVKTVYSLTARGLLPHVRFGRQLRIDLRRLDEQAEAEIQSNMKSIGRPWGPGQRTSPGAPGPRGAGRLAGETHHEHSS